ncbi:hypothetical protein GCM10010832_04490 [Psychroflexus planctonicus]|uniref:Uncharacterized protein n=1 Tax=Psychroflexus planctonicus TaxID=1526575 RepID=A0ABQ1SC38_9FLAO|nr:hypothetical protein GCM10010832_04490 [Psychroflexus planctonicus]
MNSLASATFVSNKTKIDEAEKLLPNQVEYNVSAKIKNTNTPKSKFVKIRLSLLGFIKTAEPMHNKAKKWFSIKFKNR